MEFIRENWIILIFIGVFLHLIIRRGYLMTRKSRGYGGHRHDNDGHHNKKHIANNEKSKKSCCCSHKEKK